MLFRLAGAIVVAALLTWCALLVVLVLARPNGMEFRDVRRFVPDLVRLVRALSRDPEVSRGVRVRLALLLAYLALPFDLVPDFVPVLGYADDVIVVAIVLRSVVRHGGTDALDRHWRGSEQGRAVLQRLAGLT
jgi:uncharacterized membrane protein YkvA (DUF1232 family)